MDINFISKKALVKRTHDDHSNSLLNKLRKLEKRMIETAENGNFSLEEFYEDEESVKNVCSFLKFKNFDFEISYLCDDLIMVTVYWGEKKL